MPNLPAHCLRCGTAFFSPIHIPNNIYDVTVENVHSNCPKCGSLDANVVSGSFGVNADGIFTQTAGERVDTELFTKLGLILVEAKLSNATPSEIIERVGPHSPSLAKRLSAVADNPQAFAIVLAAMIGAIGVLGAAALNNTHTSPPIIFEHNNTINVSPSEGELLKTRDNLHKLRHQGRPLPSWVGEHFHPKKR